MTIPAISNYQQPAAEPLTNEQVKTYLRIDGESEDAMIDSFIIAARVAAEKYMGVSIMEQKWKVSFNDSVAEEVFLPYGPVTAVDSVKVIDEDGGEVVFSADNYYLAAGNEELIFRLTPAGHRIEIIYSTGFTDDVDEVPELIRHGLLVHIAYMYERNMAGAEINATAKSLYNFYRNVRI